MRSTNRFLSAIVIVVVVLLVAAGIFVWSGLYDIGADAPHATATRALIDSLREHSIAAREGAATVPNLDDPGRIAEGVEHYSEMCTGCHLAPGVTESEIRPGLYPMPPDLSRLGAKDPRRAFWIIKHGIKMSAMPAWGKTHTDDQIWDMVAFVRRMPGMTAAQYQALGGKAPEEEEDHMQGMDGMPAMHDMPGMEMPAPAPGVHEAGTPPDHDPTPPHP